MKTITRLLSLALWIAPVPGIQGEPVQEIASHLDSRWLTAAEVDVFVRDNCPGKVVVVLGQGMNGGCCSSLPELRKVVESDCPLGLVAEGIGSRECPLEGLVEVMIRTWLD